MTILSFHPTPKNFPVVIIIIKRAGGFVKGEKKYIFFHLCGWHPVPSWPPLAAQEKKNPFKKMMRFLAAFPNRFAVVFGGVTA